jgi:hypothetical protein
MAPSVWMVAGHLSSLPSDSLNTCCSHFLFKNQRDNKNVKEKSSHDDTDSMNYRQLRLLRAPRPGEVMCWAASGRVIGGRLDVPTPA